MNLRAISTLQLALGISVAVHLALLTVRFVDPERFNRVFKDTPLEVILVNAKTTERPDKAQAIAQANMAGGGEAERGRATSPLPPAMVNMRGDDQAKDPERQLTNMQEQQAMILAEVKSALTAMPTPDPKRQSNNAERVEREQKRRELIKLLAEIERRINMENARPKKRYVSPATLARVDAVYSDHMRRSIEDKGTQNFPQQGGQKLYGALTMIVTVNHDGRVVETEVIQTSGIPMLDRRAQAIVQSAGPFGRFSPEMRRQQDQMAIPYRFNFTREDTLQAKTSVN